MLPAAARLRHAADFTPVLRTGRKAGRGPLVLHYLPGPVAGSASGTCRVGFVIGKPVGNAVARNRLRRRLRHLLRDRLPQLPPGASLVVRALPGAAEQAFSDLERSLDAALTRLTPAA